MAIGIYIHIPFCASKCAYCDFNSYVASKELHKEYIDALCVEIKNCDKRGQAVDTVYFGGGTPTILEANQLCRVLDTIKESFALCEDCEITTECNPATMGYDGFCVLKNAGFNRISIGLQSADDEQLKILGRIHTFSDGRECVDSARRAGFDNISLDLMFGIPKQDIESWEKTLRLALGTGVEHMSCYALKIEKGTPFFKMDLELADDDESRDMYDVCTRILEKSGYNRYEISNFAKHGFESRHNKKYWQCNDFIGFGAGAYSCADGERFSNVRSTEKYIRDIQTKGTAVVERILLTNEEKMSELVYLGLRMEEGVSRAEFSKRFGACIDDIYKEQIEKNLKRGTLTDDGVCLRIPSQYMYVSNFIMVDFI